MVQRKHQDWQVLSQSTLPSLRVFPYCILLRRVQALMGLSLGMWTLGLFFWFAHCGTVDIGGSWNATWVWAKISTLGPLWFICDSLVIHYWFIVSILDSSNIYKQFWLFDPFPLIRPISTVHCVAAAFNGPTGDLGPAVHRRCCEFGVTTFMMLIFHGHSKGHEFYIVLLCFGFLEVQFWGPTVRSNRFHQWSW